MEPSCWKNSFDEDYLNETFMLEMSFDEDYLSETFMLDIDFLMKLI